MTWFPLAVSVLIDALLAGIMFVMPDLVPRTLPLGVSVPAARVDEPVIGEAVRRFRREVIAEFVIAVLVTAALYAVDPALAMTVSTLVLLALVLISYVRCRELIRRAKAAHDWYRDVPVRLQASVTAEEPAPALEPAWFVAAFVVLAAATVWGILVYPGLPARVPVHWNGSGAVDRYAAKSVWSVFGPLLVGLGIVVVCFGIAAWSRAVPPRVRGGGDPATLERRARVQQHLMQGVLGQIALAVTLVISALTVIGWVAPGASAAMTTVGILVPVLVAVVLVIFLVRYRAGMRASEPARAAAARGDAATRSPDAVGARAGRESRSADAPDDDRHWKLGVFYVNRNDPATMVPKRFGVGWTVNLGSRGGMAIGIALLVIVVASIVIGIVVPGSHAG